VDLGGKIIEGKGRPSSDTPTHLELYNAFPSIGGVAHTHNEFATSFAQACREIECYGTTHADAFDGAIPVTRFLTKDEVEKNYELNTGKLITERFKNLGRVAMLAVLIAGYAPFIWGNNARDAVKNSLILERVASMAFRSVALNPELPPLPEYLLNKHHLRKHGPEAYYGQPQKTNSTVPSGPSRKRK
jgi:L-ribulose-5-phosphate 4-epimerase